MKFLPDLGQEQRRKTFGSMHWNRVLSLLLPSLPGYREQLQVSSIQSSASPVARVKMKLDGCIVWNSHNTVFGSKNTAICAQAVNFLHSTRPSVTWLDSLWWLAACDGLMSALSAVWSTRVGRRRKCEEASCTECRGQANDFELIPIVK